MPILPVIQNQWAPVESICYWRPIVQILILYDWYSFLQTPSSSYTEWCMLVVTWFLCHKDTYIASPDNLVFTGTRIHKLKVIQCISCCTGTKQLAIAFSFNYWLCLVVQLHLVYGNALDQYPVFDLDCFIVDQSKYLHPSYNLECKTTTCRVAITIYWIPSYNWMKKNDQGCLHKNYTSNTMYAFLLAYTELTLKAQFMPAGTRLDCN